MTTSYLLFVYRECYPNGGFEDFVGHWATPEEAEEAARSTMDEHGTWLWHIVDRNTLEIVKEGWK